jgi:hypothetical protein
MKTTTNTFKWLLSGKAEKLRKRIEEIRIEFLKMIENEHTNNQY